MEKQALSVQRSPDTNNLNGEREMLIGQWVVRFALNADKPLPAEEQAAYRTIWTEALCDLPPNRLLAAFVACIRSHAFKTMPTIADIRKHIDKAEANEADEKAALKFDEVMREIRLNYNPDIGSKYMRPFSERTRRAINAAGGMAYLSECIGDDRVFARKRFIESDLRWEELKQDEYLLPDREIKKLLADAARTMSVTRLLGPARPPVPKPPELPDQRAATPLQCESVRLVDVEGRMKDLQAQAELIKQKYPPTGKEARPCT